MQKITPFLWFDNQAEEAAKFYVDVFNTAPRATPEASARRAGSRKKSKVGNGAEYGEAGSEVSGQPKGSTMIAEFELDGQEFTALNGGPQFKFTEAISFLVNCENQEEVDHFWNKLTAGGKESQCGWLKDKFGLSWQIVPSALGKLMGDPDPVKSQKVMQAMLKMKKIDIAELKRAYDGK